jgi:hypothetical protein
LECFSNFIQEVCSFFGKFFQRNQRGLLPLE